MSPLAIRGPSTRTLFLLLLAVTMVIILAACGEDLRSQEERATDEALSDASDLLLVAVPVLFVGLVLGVLALAKRSRD
jgi:hypothetical protein